MIGYDSPDGYVSLKPEVAIPVCKNALESIKRTRDSKLRIEVTRLCDKVNDSFIKRLLRRFGFVVKQYEVDELLKDRKKLDVLRGDVSDALIDEIGWALLTGWQCKEVCNAVVSAEPAETI